MKNREIIKLFVSTALFFIFGFVLNFIIEIFIEYRNIPFFIVTRLLIMILSGTLLFFILNKLLGQKSLKTNNITFLTYMKWRCTFIVILALISIYFNRNNFINRELIVSLLDKINKLFFHTSHESIMLNFDFVTQSMSTIFFTVIIIFTFLFFEFFFDKKNRKLV